MTTTANDNVAKRLIELSGSIVLNSEIEEAVKFIRAQQGGTKLLEGLAAYQGPEPLPAPQQPIQPFEQKVYCFCSMLNLVVYHKIQIKIDEFGKVFDGQGGGATPGLPGAPFWGYLHFNDRSEISGEYSYMLSMTPATLTVTFFRDNKAIMAFIAAGIGGAGVAGGSGRWN